MNVKKPEASKACLVRYLDHWDTISEVQVVFRGQDFADFMKTPLISVSRKKEAAKGFAGNKSHGRVFTLYLHPGVRYLDFSESYDKIGIITLQHEAEIVIPGNSRFVPRKYDPLVIDVYPQLYTPYFVLPNLNNNNRPALLYNVRGLNKRLLKSRNTSRKNTGGPNMSAVNGGRRLRQQRRLSRRLRSKSRKSQ